MKQPSPETRAMARTKSPWRVQIFIKMEDVKEEINQPDITIPNQNQQERSQDPSIKVEAKEEDLETQPSQ